MKKRLVEAILPIISRWAYAPRENRPTTQDVANQVARVVLQIMRDPAADMKAADGVHWDYSCHVCGGVAEGWQKMIDQALKE